MTAVLGADGDDEIDFDELGEMYRGRGGNDYIAGLTDVAHRFDGGAGNDTLFGANGVDAVIYTHASGGVSVTLPGLGSSANTVTPGSGEGTDTLLSIEDLVGSTFGVGVSHDFLVDLFAT